MLRTDVDVYNADESKAERTLGEKWTCGTQSPDLGTFQRLIRDGSSG